MLFCLFFSTCYALETDTHRDMNRYIARKPLNGFSLDTYLKNLGIQNGINEVFNSKRVYTWLGEGGIREDAPDWYSLLPRRAVNHFHNPLSDISEAGFHGFFGGTMLHGDSSIVWSQKPLGEQSPGGCYSWEDVQNYFFKALTATDKASRDNYFAETFRGLGQLMHLVEDLSVPEHTRDDGHVFKAYEGWVKDNVIFNPEIKVNGASVNPFYYDISSLTQGSPFPEAGDPVARLFDSQAYDGSNPNDTLRPDIGLSEYTNANFVSPDTIFSAGLTYPANISTCVKVQDLDIPDPLNPGNTVLRPYYMKIGNGDSGYRLAGVDYFRVYRISQIGEYDKIDEYSIPPMDERVFEDYAKKLIPRAVGYGAALMDYFFQGGLKVYSVPIFYGNDVYAYGLNITNNSHTGGANSINTAQNATNSMSLTEPGRTLSNGKFSIVVRYTPEGGNPDGSDDIFVGSTGVDSGTLHYGENANFQFTLHESVPIENFKSAKCVLVFRGMLGNEENAVIGKPFNPGKLRFIEEWDNGVSTVEHPWFHTIQGSDQNYDNGKTINTMENGVLNKSNIRYINEKQSRINESFIYFGNFADSHKVVDPDISPDGMLITPNTYLIFKIDDLSINQQPPADPGYTNAYQYFELKFNAILNGQLIDNFPALEFSLPGQAFDQDGVNELAYNFHPGAITVCNIYNLFQRQGFTVPEPFYLQVIDLTQMLWDLSEPSTIEHRQDMAVDFISIVEGSHDQAEQQ